MVGAQREDAQQRGAEATRVAAGAWTRTMGGGWCLEAPGGGVWDFRLGRLQSGGGRSPGVGTGVALAASSRREELCEAGRAALAFILSQAAGSPKN